MSRALRWAVLAVSAFQGLPRLAAQAPTAICTTQNAWIFNSLGQSPCIVAEYLGGVCNNGEFTVPQLNSTQFYTPPPATAATPCRCSSVFYSLISACAYCQGNEYVKWSAWITNCSAPSVGSFPEDLPAGTAVPAWAYENVTISNQFDVTIAKEEAGAPESTALPKTSSTGAPIQTPTNTLQGKGNAGQIAGGVVGGVVALCLAVALTVWLFRRHRVQNTVATAVPAEGGMGHRPMSDASAFEPYSTVQTRKLYDPSDPSTFPVSPATSPGSNTTLSSHQYYDRSLTSSGPVAGYYPGSPEVYTVP